MPIFLPRYARKRENIIKQKIRPYSKKIWSARKEKARDGSSRSNEDNFKNADLKVYSETNFWERPLLTFFCTSTYWTPNGDHFKYSILNLLVSFPSIHPHFLFGSHRNGPLSLFRRSSQSRSIYLHIWIYLKTINISLYWLLHIGKTCSSDSKIPQNASKTIQKSWIFFKKRHELNPFQNYLPVEQCPARSFLFLGPPSSPFLTATWIPCFHYRSVS